MRPETLRDRLVNASDRLFGYPDDAIHFLHVPKTAGSQIKLVARQVNEGRFRNRIRAHPHDEKLINLPKNQRYFFSTREPVARFFSAFYWTRGNRKMNPKKAEPPNELRAFALFESANDLAEALFLPDRRGIVAALAMKSIRHTSRNLVDNFTRCGFDLELRPPVWIIRIEHLQEDLAEFLRRIGHDTPVDTESVAPYARRQSYDGAPPLSDLAKDNLRRWYAQDFEFLRACEDWLSENGASFAHGRVAD